MLVLRQTVPENSLSLGGTAIIMQERLPSKEDVFLVLSWGEKQRECSSLGGLIQLTRTPHPTSKVETRRRR